MFLTIKHKSFKPILDFEYWWLKCHLPIVQSPVCAPHRAILVILFNLLLTSYPPPKRIFLMVPKEKIEVGLELFPDMWEVTPHTDIHKTKIDILRDPQLNSRGNGGVMFYWWPHPHPPPQHVCVWWWWVRWIFCLKILIFMIINGKNNWYMLS